MNTLEIFLRCPNLFASENSRDSNYDIVLRGAGHQATGNPRLAFNPRKRMPRTYGYSHALIEYKLEELEVNHEGTEILYSATYSNHQIKYSQPWNSSLADRAIIYYYEKKAFIVDKLMQMASSYLSADKLRTNVEPKALDENTAKLFLDAEEELLAILRAISSTQTKLALPNGKSARLNDLPRYGPLTASYGGGERTVYIGRHEKTQQLTVTRANLKDFIVRYAHDTTAGDFSIQLSARAEQRFQGNMQGNNQRINVNVPFSHNGLHLRIVGPEAGERITSTDEVSCTNLQIYTGGTLKRKARGAYNGPYQGPKEVVLSGKNVLTYRMPAGNPAATIALPKEYTGLPTVQAAHRMPLGGSPNRAQMHLHLEAFKETFPRPELDVKPTRIGHLLFYRIGEATVHIPFAQTLSDLILPSMAHVMISVKAPTVTSSTDEYVGGESCRGDCDDSSTVSEPLAPGLYLVEREVLCGRGHDTGRLEYIAGFGDYVNERMSTMSLLSKLQVAFDNTRLSSVGSGETMASDFDFDEIAFSGLGRL